MKKFPAFPAVLYFIIMSASIFWGFFSSIEAKNAYADAAAERESCAFEAYLSFSEYIEGMDGASGERLSALAMCADDALSRCELFSGGEPHKSLHRFLSEFIRGAVPDGGISPSVICSALLSAGGGSSPEAALASAEGAAELLIFSSDGAASQKSDRHSSLLSNLPEVSEAEAHKIAAQYAGVGAKLTLADEDGGVYTYVCGNIVIEITRRGGRLYRLYKFCLGNADGDGEGTTLSAAREMLRRAGFSSPGSRPLSLSASDAKYDVYDSGGVTLRVSKEKNRCLVFDAAGYYGEYSE
ncbi:MAG: hypothetical protein LUD44_03425 [Firmicutes bacterium]|nr:hypothetical protein [Bacillota bacterium]